MAQGHRQGLRSWEICPRHGGPRAELGMVPALWELAVHRGRQGSSRAGVIGWPGPVLWGTERKGPVL